MAHSKPLLVPWLRQQINSGQYPGVAWTNQEQTQFCIPWKHALRQDSCGDDVLIFKAWAETSIGRQADGRTPGDPSVWKRNFRSALRAKGFKLLSDNKNDAANPHKVFKWPHEETTPIGPPDTPEHIYLADGEEGLFLDSSDVIQRCMDNMKLSETQPDTMALGCGAGLTEQHTHEGDFTVGQQCFNQQPSEAVPCQSKDNTDNTGEWLQDTFRVMVYYRGQKVLEKLVENEAGFRLLYSPDAGHFFDVALPLVCLPPPSQILDQTQANLTACILENMGGGLEVTLKNNVVHGRRHGDCKVFWSNCKHDQSKIHRELSKHHLEPLLALKNFVSELLEFVNSGGTSPPMSLFFCLGEKWPDPKLKPWEKKLITVEVAFGVLEKLKEIGVTGGASSLRSVELQLSLDKMDVC
ncbi:interferon regulatory factor 3 [Denticeps clupeoides]|uniref:interferon regulatory factor 3 n=1 Tax=Denticeps clupeoides TaxID=299321 RepID=UPI0010A4C381|nr:interferon regulatory factor 3-like [Denticeps clupeoides]